MLESVSFYFIEHTSICFFVLIGVFFAVCTASHTFMLRLLFDHNSVRLDVLLILHRSFNSEGEGGVSFFHTVMHSLRVLVVLYSPDPDRKR